MVEGVVRSHKPFGVFIDLPSLGGRASGLLPLEESGTGKASELPKRFPVGQKIMVAVDQVDEKGRIRLAIPSEKAGRGPHPAQPARGAGSAMADALRRALEQRKD
jgi:ribosomal protein S1